MKPGNLCQCKRVECLAFLEMSSPMSFQHITVTPLTPTIGARIAGVDLRQPHTDEVHQELEQAWLQHLVLFFDDQPLSIQQHKAFARRFGEFHVHPTAPGVNGDPVVFAVHADEHSKFHPGDSWHSDVSCDPQPPMGSVLHLFEVPPSGGDTLFVNMYAVYETLSPSMQSLLEGLTAHHSSAGYSGRYEDKARRDGVFPRAIHPVVRTHPSSGKKALFVNEGFTTHIDGLHREESQAILQMLFRLIREPRFQVRFTWRKHSVAMWDNRCTQHHALWDYFPHVRSGYRVTIRGERPV